jgi:hypothetical protein
VEPDVNIPPHEQEQQQHDIGGDVPEEDFHDYEPRSAPVPPEMIDEGPFPPDMPRVSDGSSTVAADFASLKSIMFSVLKSINELGGSQLMSRGERSEKLRILESTVAAMNSGHTARTSGDLLDDISNKRLWFDWALRSMARMYRDERRVDILHTNKVAERYNDILEKIRSLSLQGDPKSDGLVFPYVTDHVESDSFDAPGGGQVWTGSTDADDEAVERFRSASRGFLETVRTLRRQFDSPPPSVVGSGRSEGFWITDDQNLLTSSFGEFEKATLSAEIAYRMYVQGTQELLAEYTSWVQAYADGLSEGSGDDNDGGAKQFRDMLGTLKELVGDCVGALDSARVGGVGVGPHGI